MVEKQICDNCMGNHNGLCTYKDFRPCSHEDPEKCPQFLENIKLCSDCIYYSLYEDEFEPSCRLGNDEIIAKNDAANCPDFNEG